MDSNSNVHFLTMPNWGCQWNRERSLVGARPSPVSEGEIDRAIEDRGRLTASIGTNATPDVDDPGSPKSGIVLVENWSIKYAKTGTGSSALILIHDLAGDISAWRHIRASLKGDWIAHSPDLPGHGELTKALAALGGDRLPGRRAGPLKPGGPHISAPSRRRIPAPDQNTGGLVRAVGLWLAAGLWLLGLTAGTLGAEGEDRQQATIPDAGQVAEGRQVFLSAGCYACHGLNGSGRTGPASNSTRLQEKRPGDCQTS